MPAIISRTGYTGEDGFELYVAAGGAERLWTALIEAGRPDGIQPIGLGARDTLRLEMKYALYGNDIDETTNPLEAGLGWVVKLAKGDFIGREAIEALRARGVARKLVGFEMAERAVPRHGYRLMADGAPVGVVTSGSFGPVGGALDRDRLRARRAVRGGQRAGRGDPGRGARRPRGQDPLPSLAHQEGLGEQRRWRTFPLSSGTPASTNGPRWRATAPASASPPSPRSSSATWSSSSCPRWARRSPR